MIASPFIASPFIASPQYYTDTLDATIAQLKSEGRCGEGRQGGADMSGNLGRPGDIGAMV